VIGDVFVDASWVVGNPYPSGLGKSCPSYVRNPSSAPAESRLVPLIQSTDRISRQKSRA